MKAEIYIALLRGINVGGHKIVKMEALRKVLADNGFDAVKTYIQSGNIILKASKSNAEKLAEKISHLIENEFGFLVPVIVLELQLLKDVIAHNPFLTEKYKDESYLHATFLSDNPSTVVIEEIVANNQDDDELMVGEKVLYLYCPNSYSKSKLTNAFLEKKLKLHTTTRNWRTTLKLLEIADTL